MGRLVRGRFLRQADHFRNLVIGGLRCSRRAGLLAEQTVHAALHKAVLPAPDAFLGLARRRNNCHRAKAIAAQNDNPATPDMPLRGRWMGDDRIKTGTIFWA